MHIQLDKDDLLAKKLLFLYRNVLTLKFKNKSKTIDDYTLGNPCSIKILARTMFRPNRRIEPFFNFKRAQSTLSHFKKGFKLIVLVYVKCFCFLVQCSNGPFFGTLWDPLKNLSGKRSEYWFGAIRAFDSKNWNDAEHASGKNKYENDMVQWEDVEKLGSHNIYKRFKSFKGLFKKPWTSKNIIF